MRTLLLATSTLAVATAVPALAADIYVPVQEQFPEEYFEGNKAAGYVDLHYGFAWLSYEESEGGFPELAGPGESLDYRTFGIAGRGNLPFAPNSMFNLQLDGTADTLFVAGKSRGLSLTPIEATAHLYTRDPALYSAGIFGSYGVVNGSNIWGGGIEGQYFFDRVTAYAQGGYRTVETGYNNDEWYVRGIGRWFPTDNIRLEGEIGYSWLSVEDSPNLNTLFWGATAEYRFDHMPLGIYAQYRGASYSFDGELPVDITGVNAALFGVRAHLGSNNLIDNDRRGASYDTRVIDPIELLTRIETNQK